MKGIEGLLAGHTLAGRYRIQDVIGRGGYAAVYRAKDENLQRTVAVKVMMVSAQDPEARKRIRARFHREARAAARLQHPNVVTVYDFGTDSQLGLDFLVMELLHGVDLSVYLVGSGALPPERGLLILRQAVEGVAAGHRAGLIHRDVKPGNLFLVQREAADVLQVKVLDFGIAQILVGDETITALTQGSNPLSPAYASPEQLRGERHLSPAADVYSLGVIAYELLSGERLFGREGVQRAGDPVPPLRQRVPAVPERVAAVIDRALSPDPAQRYPDAGTMAKALDEAHAAPLPPPAAAVDRHALPREYKARSHPRLPEQPPEPVRPEGARGGRSLARPLAVGGVLLAALAGGWWALGSDDASPGADRAAQESPAESPASVAGLEEGDPGEVDAPAPAVDPAESGGAPARSAGGTAEREPSSPGWSRNALALWREGRRRFDQGDYPGAIERFRDAVRLAPENAGFRNDLAWALFQAGRVEEAADEIEAVLRLDPRRPIAHANLGEIRLAQGDREGAVAAYERFLELNDDPRREEIARGKLASIRGGGG